MRDPNPAADANAATPLNSRGRPRARESNGFDNLMGRCKSAPDRFGAFEAYPLSTPEQPTSVMEHHEEKRNDCRGRGTLGQGTIDQYFVVKKKDGQEAAELPRSTGTNKYQVSKGSMYHRPKPPSSTAGTYTYDCTFSRIDGELSTAEKRDDTHDDLFGIKNDVSHRVLCARDGSISKQVVHESSSTSSQGSQDLHALGSSTVQCNPDNKSTKCTSATKDNANGEGATSVRLLKRGKYSIRLMSSMSPMKPQRRDKCTSRLSRSSTPGKHKSPTKEEQNTLPTKSNRRSSKDCAYNAEKKSPQEDHPITMEIHLPPRRMAYSRRTVKLPPGKVGAVLHTSSLGPAIQKIKPESTLCDLLKVGDVVVEVDGIDTTKCRAEEVTMMLINRAKRERQIVVLNKKDFAQDFSIRDDESSIDDDFEIHVDRYLGFHDIGGDDDESLTSATASSGGTTVAVGNTRAHNRARNLVKKASDPEKCIICTCSVGGDASHLCEAPLEPVWEAPERYMDSKVLSAKSAKSIGSALEPNKSAATGSTPTTSTEEVKKYESGEEIKGSTTLSPILSDPPPHFPTMDIISSAGSEISSLCDTEQLASSMQQGRETLTPPFISDLASPEEIQEKLHGPYSGVERSFSAYQLNGDRTLIAFHSDTEIELLFPDNDFEQVPVPVWQQDAYMCAKNESYYEKDATCKRMTRPARSSPPNNLAHCACVVDATETISRSMLDKWRSARRKQKARARARAKVKVNPASRSS